MRVEVAKGRGEVNGERRVGADVDRGWGGVKEVRTNVGVGGVEKELRQLGAKRVWN